MSIRLLYEYIMYSYLQYVRHYYRPEELALNTPLPSERLDIPYILPSVGVREFNIKLVIDSHGPSMVS